DEDDDDNDEEEEIAKIDEPEDTKSGGADEEQESSSVSSFVTSMLNPTSDAGVESIFTMASSPIVSLQTPTPIMTPSTIVTITTSRYAPIPPTPSPTILKRRRKDDDQEGPSPGLDRGSKRRREGGEHASA
nr:hypothetical protein [Tanacetum cinerariifolium]